MPVEVKSILPPPFSSCQLCASDFDRWGQHPRLEYLKMIFLQFLLVESKEDTIVSTLEKQAFSWNLIFLVGKLQ